VNNLARWLGIAQWLLVAAMFAAGVAAWPGAPDTLPVHWSLSGQPDRYAGKLEGLFLLPAIALLIAIGMRVLPRFDPQHMRYQEFARAYALAGFAIVAVLAATYATILLWLRGVPLNIGLVVGPLVGLLLIVLGAVMNEIRPNWFFGIRTPWTLSSERSWTATHRVGRWVLMCMGVAIALAGVFQTQWLLYAAMVVCLGGVLGLVIYSYVVWRDDPARHRLA
jgi:immunity protein, SdpI family